jgi:hypothetical protein
VLSLSLVSLVGSIQTSQCLPMEFLYWVEYLFSYINFEIPLYFKARKCSTS